MKFKIQESNHRHLIILVHGLNGSSETWQGEKHRFVETFLGDQLIAQNFNLALFSYDTNMFQWSTGKKIANTVKGFFANSPQERIAGFNVGIEPISRTLETEIRTHHSQYRTITIIAHSMGGLVTKSALTWLNDEILGKVRLFVSLSVPHIGANLAKLGKRLLGKNPQILNLLAMGEFTTQLNERFESKSIHPKIIYQGGHQDTIVPRASAIPTGTRPENVINTRDTHFSVVLIEHPETNTIYMRIQKELRILLQTKINGNIGIVPGYTFGDFVLFMAGKLEVSVDLSTFSSDELKTELREGNLTIELFEDFFAEVGNLAITTLPKYKMLHQAGSNDYIFRKI